MTEGKRALLIEALKSMLTAILFIKDDDDLRDKLEGVTSEIVKIYNKACIFNQEDRVELIEHIMKYMPTVTDENEILKTLKGDDKC